MKKIVLIVVVVIMLLASGMYFYMNKKHRDIASEEASFSIAVKDLENEFAQNDSLSNRKYLDKTIEVYGKITSIDVATKIVVLDQKIEGTSQQDIPKELTVGVQVKMKGRFIGYDDLLGEFKMDQVAINQ
jgi:predicted negative regulator of RcsB-dependent stress response